MANNSAITYLAHEANDQSAGQTGGVAPIAGATHPSGWVNLQRWYVTAQQWHDMWAAEWANARDAQNQAYSYPGQAAYGVLWSQTAQYWRSQADFHWGPSRVFSSGVSWEDDYNAEVAAYTDMVNQRNAKTTTLISNSGFTAPHGDGVLTPALGWQGPVLSITAQRTGLAVCWATAVVGQNAGADGQMRLKQNGAVIANGPADRITTGLNDTVFVIAAFNVTVGDVLTVDAQCAGGAFGNSTANFNNGGTIQLVVGSI